MNRWTELFFFGQDVIPSLSPTSVIDTSKMRPFSRISAVFKQMNAEKDLLTCYLNGSLQQTEAAVKLHTHSPPTKKKKKWRAFLL